MFMGICSSINDYLILAGNHFLGLSSLPKSILKPAGQSLHVSHTSSTDGSATLGLWCPVVAPHLFGGVTTAGACVLLDVVRSLTTTATSRVGLVVPFSEWCGTFRLLYWEWSGDSNKLEFSWEWWCQPRNARLLLIFIYCSMIMPALTATAMLVHAGYFYQILCMGTLSSKITMLPNK